MHLFLFWLSNVQSFTCVPVCIEELAYRFPTLRVFFFFFVLKNIPLVHCLSVYFRLIKFGTSEVYCMSPARLKLKIEPVFPSE